jgi:hypothetical protein
MPVVIRHAPCEVGWEYDFRRKASEPEATLDWRNENKFCASLVRWCQESGWSVLLLQSWDVSLGLIRRGVGDNDDREKAVEVSTTLHQLGVAP